VDCNQWDAAANAILKTWSGGGWQLCVAVLAGIAFWRKPWFRDK
jgi:hypothetical protein